MTTIASGSDGTQISGYPQVTSVLPTDLFVLQRSDSVGPVGTCCISAADLIPASTYDVGMNYLSVPAASSVFLTFAAVRAFTLPSGFTGSVAETTNEATSMVALTIQKNGTSIGTITFAGSASSGSFSGEGASFVAGDLLEIASPSDLYGLANLAITFAGTLG